MASEADFGSYLATVQERDIDLLLMEEFHVSPEFATWFAGKSGVPDACFDGAWHSVTDADGETDLLLRVVANGTHVAILIENKVAAPEQDRQAERYHLRAARAQNEGKYDEFVTCMCAPQTYLEGLGASPLYQATVAYEDIEAWFSQSDDTRSRWRRRILSEAIVQGRRGYRMIVNEAVTDFHQAFWRYLTQNHPKFTMARPSPKGNKSNWILFKGVGFPPKVGFHIKLDQECVELGFNGRSVEEIIAIKASWPEDIRLVQKGKTAALSIRIPFLDRTRPLDKQVEALRATIAAAERLAPYAQLLA